MKMQKSKEFLILVTLFCVTIGLDLPSNFQKCKRSDPDFNGCLKNAIQDALPKMAKGLSELGTSAIEPIHLESMTIGEGTGAVHVVQKYKNVNLFGISSATVENVRATLDDNLATLEFDAFASNFKMEADYDFNGRVLVLPMVGNGKCTFQLDNLKIHVVIMGEVFEKKGTKHIEFKKSSITMNPEKVHFNFENLFNGDERLGTEINKLLNDNWKEIFVDVKSGYEETLAVTLQTISNKIFKKVAYTDIFPV